jgi:GT2 family glycosyltransferase
MIAALGICTYNRPEFFEKCAKSVAKHLDVPVFVYNDGSDPKHQGAYKRGYRALPDAHIVHADENHGVAYAKNQLLLAMLASGADWLILCEDDIKVRSNGAVEGYVQACEETGLHHLSFAHHGPANADGAVDTTDLLAFYTHSVGAYCIYSRESLEACGIFDESLHNAWEHVELTLRLAENGYTSGAYRFADARWSNIWLQELPNSIERSSIRPRPDWHANIVNGLRHWHDTKPSTYETMFGPGTPLHDYAERTLAAM